jgi:tetratricopeptide (TPR) repeat protein
VAPTAAILDYPADTEPATICRALGASHALRGTVQTLGSRWRVSIQLFDAGAQRVVLSEKHDFAIGDMFDVQDEIGRRVVASLHRRFPPTVARSRDRYSDDPEAYDEFMIGLRESGSGDKDILRSAAAHLTRAIERDPRFALAHATLSLVCMDMHFSFDVQRTWLNRAEEHCRRALALDDALPEGQLARAWILWSPAKGFQHAEAIAALERVLAARPQLERAHNRMSGICGHIGRLTEARLANERAQCANPLTRSGNLEWNHIYGGDFVHAEEAVEAWFRDRPDNFYSRYTRVIPPLSRGDLPLAEERLEVALSRAPGEPLLVSLEALLHARRDEPAAALECVSRALASPRSFGHTHHTYYQIAGAYSILGDTDTAMAWLERSVDNGFACWPYFRVDPHLANLRDEPAFTRLVGDLERTYSALEISRL